MRYLLTTIAIMFLVSRPLLGDSITIQNAGFEDLVLGNSQFTSTIPGWTNAGNSGTFNPTTGSYAGEAPEGANVAFSAVGGPTISQVLFDTLEAERTYTLSVEVGDRLDIAFGGYQIQLFAGGVLLAEDNNSILSINGDFFTSTVVYESTSFDAQLGQPLEIRMRSFGPQTNFDDVRLEVDAIPEPGFGMLIALVGLNYSHRRRQSRR